MNVGLLDETVENKGGFVNVLWWIGQCCAFDMPNVVIY